MVTAPEEKDDDEPRYTAWLDLPISTREPMTAKDANEARKALLALDDRTPQQRLLGEPPTWRSALAQSEPRTKPAEGLSLFPRPTTTDSLFPGP